MSDAKAGRKVTSTCHADIEAECIRLIERDDGGLPIEPMPDLPDWFRAFLPDRFELRKRASQIDLLRRAYARCDREGRFDLADRAQLQAWLSFARKRLDYEPALSRADELANLIAKGEPEYDLAYR